VTTPVLVCKAVRAKDMDQRMPKFQVVFSEKSPFFVLGSERTGSDSAPGVFTKESVGPGCVIGP
jgi:hypothetical protein